MPKPIDTVVWDADNTLWDWIKMHLEGMRAMAQKISQITGTTEGEVKSSMARVYKEAGTFDYKPLVQEMDVIEMWARTIESEREKIRRIIDLGFAVHTSYTHSRYDNFQLYPGVGGALESLQMGGINNVILSDAPISKIIRRVKRFDLEKHFSLIAGRPDAKVDEERKKGEEHLKYYEDTRREVGAYDTNVRIEVLSNQKKPDVNLSALLQKSPEEVAEQVVVVGDNFSKDIHTAYRNDCFGFFARYGAADRDSVSSLYEFAPPGVVTRNAAGIDLSKENMGIIQEMRNKLRIVDSPMEVLRAVQDHNEKIAA